MYNKCYISRSISNYDPYLKPEIGYYPINIYYIKDPTKCNTSTKTNDVTTDIKQILLKYEDSNKSKCVITYGEPTPYEYQKINQLVS